MAILRKGTDQLAAPLTGRLGANHVNQTTNGVAAEQRALRAAQYLHTLCVPYVQQCTCGGREVNPVLIDRNSGVETLLHFCVLHTADRDTDRSITQNRVDDEVGGHARDLINRSRESFLNGVRIHRGHGYRHVLHVFFALLRRHYNFFNLCRGASLGERLTGKSH